MQKMPKTALLAIVVPLSIYLSIAKAGPVLLFIAAALAILGLISIMVKSTDQISLYSGAVAGGLLNATLGNFPELIIALSALRHGMAELVKAALTGSIIGNILLIVGLSMIAGGLKYKAQKFSRTGVNASVLILVVSLVALIVPTFVHYGYRIRWRI